MFRSSTREIIEIEFEFFLLDKGDYKGGEGLRNIWGRSILQSCESAHGHGRAVSINTLLRWS